MTGLIFCPACGAWAGWDTDEPTGSLMHRPGNSGACTIVQLSFVPDGTLMRVAFQLSPDMRPHQYVDHAPGECPSVETSCMFCDGGLSACEVCGGLEGSLATSCPGVRLSYDQDQTVYHGNADYRDGGWIMGAQSIYSPAYWRGAARDD